MRRVIEGNGRRGKDVRCAHNLFAHEFGGKLAPERTAMRRTIIGHDGLIDVEHIADMLRSLALPQVNRRKVDWWSKAEQEIEDVKREAAKNDGSMVSAEHIFMRIFERAVDERGTLTRMSAVLSSSAEL